MITGGQVISVILKKCLAQIVKKVERSNEQTGQQINQRPFAALIMMIYTFHEICNIPLISIYI